jgi:hypothetical protein
LVVEAAAAALVVGLLSLTFFCCCAHSAPHITRYLSPLVRQANQSASDGVMRHLQRG